MSDISDRLLNELVDAVKDIVRKEQSDRLRDIYLIGDIEKDSARSVIERLRELANDNRKPIVIMRAPFCGPVVRPKLALPTVPTTPPKTVRFNRLNASAR